MPGTNPGTNPETNPLVRVLDNDTGHKISIRSKAVRYGNYTVLKDEPALDHNGKALPPEYATRPSSPVDEDEPGANDQGEPATKPATKNGYDAQTVDELKDEIGRRNAERPTDQHVQVAAPGNKPQLVAALVADDELLSNPN